jgi:4-amino-4-deoxy-L-arabinose transferase-like glycosyltransferase
MAALKSRLRALPERHGRTTLAILAAILAIGFGPRAYRVVEPLATPGDDAHAYYALAKSLYTEGSYGGPEFKDASDWSPGGPLLYAAAFYATGGAREGTARIVELLLGMATILLVYLLGRRIASAPVGLLAALGVAVYPPFIHSVGALYSEPLAMAALPAAILSFLWAADKAALGRGGEGRPISVSSGPSESRGGGAYWAWLLPGLLFGVTALARPEYLAVAGAFVLLAAMQAWRARGWRPGVVAAVLVLVGVLLPIAPWTVRNIVVLDRAVTISTGGGKALYVGTYLPADGEYQRVKALLLERYHHRSLPPNSQALEEVNPVPLFNRVAERYPTLPRDQALGKIGKKDFSKYFGEDPLGYLAMTARKVGRMWSSGIAEAMSSTAGRAAQILLVALGLAGLALLALRRRWWELVAIATPIAIVTAVGAVTLAAPRRNEVLMTLAFPLAATALVSGWSALSSRGS